MSPTDTVTDTAQLGQVPTEDRTADTTLAERAGRALDFIVTQLRGTFDGKIERLLALPVDDPGCAAYLAALDDINAALARVHDGTYGICHRCDGEISVARLEVVPTTTTCVPCKAAVVPG